MLIRYVFSYPSFFLFVISYPILDKICGSKNWGGPIYRELNDSRPPSRRRHSQISIYKNIHMSNLLIRLRLFFYSLFPLSSHCRARKRVFTSSVSGIRAKFIREQQSRILYLLRLIRECILPKHRPPADALLACVPFYSFLACVSLKSCYWYMRVCGMSLFFLLHFSIALRTSTCFSRLTLGNVNNMYWYSRICYCFFCLHINYSNLNYFPRDLSTKKSRVLRTQTLDYSLTIAHRLILVVDPVARALHRKHSYPARFLPPFLSHFITIPSPIREYNLSSVPLY